MIEKGTTIHIQQPKEGTFVANFGNFKEPKFALYKRNLESLQGHLVLTNPAGFMFEDSSKVDVSKLTVLVGGDIDVDTNNNIHMRKIAYPDAVFINKGDITIANEGLSSFVGPHMAHFGKILTSKGNIQIQADVVSVDLYADGNILIEEKEADIKTAITDIKTSIRIEKSDSLFSSLATQPSDHPTLLASMLFDPIPSKMIEIWNSIPKDFGKNTMLFTILFEDSFFKIDFTDAHIPVFLKTSSLKTTILGNKNEKKEVLID